MMSKIKVTYFDLFKEPLENYKIIRPLKKVNGQAYALLILFFIVTIWFLIGFFNIVTLPEEYTLDIVPYIIAGLVLLLGPIIYIVFYSRKILVFTERALFKQIHLSKYSVIPFDKVEKVATDHEKQLLMVTKDDKMKILLKHYSDELNPLMELLKYRGFFKGDPQPYEIVFEDDKVVIREVEEEMDEDTTMLFEKYIQKYAYLTPGFTDDIIFYNTQADRVQLTEGKHIIFYLTHIDVKPTHPENTHFKAQKSDDAIVIFENISDIKVKLIGEEGEGTKLVGDTIQSLRETSKKAIIFDATIREEDDYYRIEFTMSQEVKKHRVSFLYTQVIVGWNKLVEDSWFEK